MKLKIGHPVVSASAKTKQSALLLIKSFSDFYYSKLGMLVKAFRSKIQDRADGTDLYSRLQWNYG